MTSRESFATIVARWFHIEDSDDNSPADTVGAIATELLSKIKSTRFDFAYSNQKFRFLLCEFICTLYHASLTEKAVSGPYTLPKLPESWTNEIYNTWIDYLHHAVFTEEFWEMLWHHIPKCEWLEDIRNWEAEIQALIPYLVKPDHEQMMRAGLLFEDHDGNVITAEDYDSGTEDYRDWYY